MRSSIPLLLYGLALAWTVVLATAPAAEATAVNITADRQISSQGNADDPAIPDSDAWNQADASLLLGVFDSTVFGAAGITTAGADGIAAQNTDVTAGAVGGTGFVGAELVFTDPPTATAQSDNSTFFDVTFDLLVPHAFTLTGLLDASSLAVDAATSASLASFVLGEQGLTPLVEFETTSQLIDFGQINGLLNPGTYHLTALATTLITSGPGAGQGNGFANFDFNLSLTEVGQPVPEASTLALLGTGMLGLVCMRRRRAA